MFVAALMSVKRPTCISFRGTNNGIGVRASFSVLLGYEILIVTKYFIYSFIGKMFFSAACFY